MAWGMAAAASQRAQAAAERAAKAEVKAQASHADVLKAGAAAASILRVTQNSIKRSHHEQCADCADVELSVESTACLSLGFIPLD